MKKIVVTLMASIALVTANAQTNNDLKAHYMKMYTQAINYSDLKTAIYALNGYLSIDTSVVYKDTLAQLYFDDGQYTAAYLYSKELWETNKNNQDALARMAFSSESLGALEESEKKFSILALQSNDPYHYYKLAGVQVKLNKIEDAEKTYLTVVKDTSISNKIPVSSELSNGQSQTVPASAAAYNFLGVIAANKNNFAKAKEYLDKAVKIFPSYYVAKQNQEGLKKLGKQPAPAKPAASRKG
jgi:tetratricopeptide (TPR) repeat protein